MTPCFGIPCMHVIRAIASPYEEEETAAGADGCFCSSRLIPLNQSQSRGTHVHVKGKESLEEPVSSYKAQGSAPRDNRS